MPKKSDVDSVKSSNGATIGFEEKLWKAADKLRGHMDAAEYKHVVLGLIFLKYISDAFEAAREEIKNDPDSTEDELEDKDAYLMRRAFWVPKEARWSHIQANAVKPTIGKIIDDAMLLIEKDNQSLKGVLPRNYARTELDKQKLGEVVNLIGTIMMHDAKNKSKDILGRVYEYFLGRFASAEGKAGGEFYTPQCVVKVLVNMLEPYKGRVFDPCCGSGGMFIQSEHFTKEHGGRVDDIAVYGQEYNATTWKLAKMNLALNGISGNLGPHHGDSFNNDLHKDLKADFIIANPPFNMSDWGGDRLKEDVRWKYGTPPTGNANYAWIQHFIHHLSPSGVAGFVMANGALSSNTSGEGEIRKNMIEAGLVDCIVALPPQLFYSTAIPVSLWFVSRDRSNHKFRDRRNEILFIDARNLGTMIDRRHRELTEEEIARISDTYHAWRTPKGKYEDVLGFCRATPIEEVAKYGHVLTPGRYVGSARVEDDDEVFEEKMKRLTGELAQQFAEGKELEKKIKTNLKSIGYTI